MNDIVAQGVIFLLWAGMMILLLHCKEFFSLKKIPARFQMALGWFNSLVLGVFIGYQEKEFHIFTSELVFEILALLILGQALAWLYVRYLEGT